MLGVKKWELGEKEAVRCLGTPPVFFPNTGLNRVQNLKDLFTEKYSQAVYQESVKMDGSAMTVYFIKKTSQFYRSVPVIPGGTKADLTNGRFGVCSKNIDLAEGGGSIFWEVALKHRLPDKLSKIDRSIAIQGELCGSSI
ncbi:Uu.00g041140.m01.CDS01 [Anthostomella pinea]|uniref:Uu.00g041140.m01.CDS01 n=1 Tax=Anthostomella pinea TaxID=933095 RepID=A0AAI8VAC2_9PEZI|nr:Uu.00g041140.m01.CDS01 [Anthostomella pinea]